MKTGLRSSHRRAPDRKVTRWGRDRAECESVQVTYAWGYVPVATGQFPRSVAVYRDAVIHMPGEVLRSTRKGHYLMAATGGYTLYFPHVEMIKIVGADSSRRRLLSVEVSGDSIPYYVAYYEKGKLHLEPVKDPREYVRRRREERDLQDRL